MNPAYARMLVLSCAAPSLTLACGGGASQESSQSSFSTGSSSLGDDEVGDGDGDGQSGNSDFADSGECSEGDEQCKADGHRVCSGGIWVPQPCTDGSFCSEQTDSCVTCACAPGERGDCVDSSSISICADDCSGYQPQPCEGVCVDGACTDGVCVPGQLACADLDSVRICNQAGTGWNPSVDCGAGEACLAGACVSACELASASKSNVGCEFWAVDMENLPPRDRYTYAVAISNPSFDDPATISFWDAKQGTEQMLFTDQVAPREAKVFNLSGAHAQFTSYYQGEDAGFIGSGIARGRAFRVRTSQPVIATQFNPIGGAAGYTTDASLLLPTPVLGLHYILVEWNKGHGSGSSFDILATEDNTTITITPTADTPAGKNGLPAMSAGKPTAVVIDKYDYIQVGGGSKLLTGTRIDSDKPVAVFGGHTCASVPEVSVAACDHIEEQIFPLTTWGTNYVAARNPERGGESMRWRILAAEDETTLSFDPPVAVGKTATLDAGQMLEFDEDEDFFVAADDPILVAGYMHGCTATDHYPDSCPGDPSMVLMVPVEQYQQDYVFLVDSSYERDFAKLVRPSGAEVSVECLGVVPEARWTPIGDSGWDWATIDMNPGEAACSPGTNQASGAQGFGVIVLGQAYAASYAYPGGLALEEINPQ